MPHKEDLLSKKEAMSAMEKKTKDSKKGIKKIVLAYSGGLDTSVIIPWLKENYDDPEIIAVSGNVGQADELDGLEEKALKTGASKLIIADLVDEMVDDVIIPSLKMDAKYETYLLGTAFARPVIGKKLAEIALAEGADAVCHGATGKGNDQVRFELAIKRFAPGMKIIAPWREWSIKSRDEEIDYAEAHNVPLKISRETNYSKDKNLWHLSHEGLDLEDPANEPDLDKPGFLEMGVSPYKAPDTPTYVTLDFEAGAPVAVDGVRMKASKIIEKLNELGGANGIGIIDIVENRLVGMKDRGVYETPGGTILYFAHEQLEMITVDKDTLHLKKKLSVDFADQIYNGKWYTPLTEALIAFANKSNEHVTGSVKLKLYKGNIIPAGMTSPYSLYSEELVTFGESEYDQKQAEGFINLWGLPTTVQAMLEKKTKGQGNG
jgi:argininosuccinate synthase